MSSIFYYESPIGRLLIKTEGEYIIYLGFGTSEDAQLHTPHSTLHTQLDAYFEGSLQSFELPIKLTGTPFRKRVWEELAKIPYGETRSYKDIAVAIGNPKAVRAVGGANHHNPISIIIPCHRVIGANGALTGYGGELWRKEWLLDHEKKYRKSP